MRIQNLNASQPLRSVNFKAMTTITAPESLLSQADREYFEEIGSKIGTDRDVIEITISDLHDSKYNKNIKEYSASKYYKFDKKSPYPSLNLQGISVPFIKNGELIEEHSPKNYIATAFARLIRRA